MCTLRYFPSKIEHCIEWARDIFDGAFVNIIKDIKSFLEDRNKFYDELSKSLVASDQINKLKIIIRYINILIQKNYKECIKIALEEYNEIYYYEVMRILERNPQDSLNDDGTKFWSGNKRCPHPLIFNIENELVFIFIENYAKILANSMSIPIIKDKEKIKIMISEIISQNFDFQMNHLKKSKKENYSYSEKISSWNPEIEKDLKKQKKQEILKRLRIDNEKLISIKNELLNFDFFNLDYNNLIKIQEFEKDEDTNGHIDFLYAASNLRAEMFKIEKCDKIKTKLIAGKITPAVASTTAAIVGLVSLQLYTLQQTTEIKYLRNSYINLSLNSISFCSPGKLEENNEETGQIKDKNNSIFSFFYKAIPKKSMNKN